MRKTLEQRALNKENNVEDNFSPRRKSLLSNDETYESANSGFFASAGEIIDSENRQDSYFL